jgi:hypothetical protein
MRAMLKEALEDMAAFQSSIQERLRQMNVTIASLAPVASSGSFNDLVDRPSSIVTDISVGSQSGEAYRVSHHLNPLTARMHFAMTLTVTSSAGLSKLWRRNDI